MVGASVPRATNRDGMNDLLRQWSRSDFRTEAAGITRCSKNSEDAPGHHLDLFPLDNSGKASHGTGRFSQFTDIDREAGDPDTFVSAQ